MTKRSILVSYLISKGAGRSSGMRVWSDGQAEIKTGAEPWKKVVRLEAEALGRLGGALRASGIRELPARLGALEGVFDAPACTWQASFDEATIKAVVEGWTDARADDLRLGSLMDLIYQEISEAQMSATR